MRLQNISNNRKTLRLFLRNEDGTQEVKTINDFQPYYYEPSSHQDAIGYDGESLQKLSTINPADVRKQASQESYEADVWFTKKFIIDRIDKIEQSKTKIVFWDIEVNALKLPRPKEEKCAIYPISCITIYDNYTKKYKTFFIEDYKSEHEMLEDFCKTIKILAPDILAAWNISFDYLYCYYRFPDFATKISPINETRWSQGIDYPAGISIVDMLGLYHKATLGKKDSYALMNVGNDELDYEIEEDFDFTDINKTKEKNILDVKKMVELDEKLQLFEYFDEIRLLSKCLWEDLPSERRNNQWQSNNSKVIDMLALAEARKLGVVLPSKRRDVEHFKFDGAFRETRETGLKKDLAKVDVSGAYPQMILDFCLSPENFVKEPEEDTLTIPLWSRATKENPSELVATYYVKQNPNAILPSLVRHLVMMKKEWKDKLNSVEKDTPEYKRLEMKYNSRKALVNSAFGVIGMPYFRLYDARVGATITFLVREILQNAKESVEKIGKVVEYVDTDSLFHSGKEDLTNKLNIWTFQLLFDKYKNANTNVEFDYEGYFSEIFIVALCRYIGRLQTSKGQKNEIKGIQMKRKDSGPWVKEFQKILLNMILDDKKKDEILNWVNNQIKKMKKINLIDIAIPCKIGKPREDYGKNEIFFRALDNTQELIPEFEKEIGTKFWWLPAEGEKDVYAIDKKYLDHIPSIDWKALIEKNMINLLVPIFKGLNWEDDLLELASNQRIIIKSQLRNKLIEGRENEVELKKYWGAREVKKRWKALDTQ